MIGVGGGGGAVCKCCIHTPWKGRHVRGRANMLWEGQAGVTGGADIRHRSKLVFYTQSTGVIIS